MRIIDFIAHDRGEFQAHQAETNHAEGIQNKTRIRGNPKIRRRHRGAEAHPNYDTQTDKNGRCKSRADCTEIVEPLSDTETKNVQHHQQE